MNRLSEQKRTLKSRDLEEMAGRLNASQRRQLAHKFLRWALDLLDSAAELELIQIKERFDRRNTDRGGN